MTTETNVEVQSSSGSGSNSAENVNAGDTNVPNEVKQIFEFLSNNRNIVFKSQQIDDPELERDEKINIAHTIYALNRQTFLARFGCYFEKQHLEVFARVVISNAVAPLQQHENQDEMLDLVENFKLRLVTRAKDVKNRRYAAMQKLIKDGEYFSEQEMMKRAPDLYQEMVGQYLSDAEKKLRDSYDVRNTTMSGILMHTMVQEQVNEMLKKADNSSVQNYAGFGLEDRTSKSFENNSTVQVKTICAGDSSIVEEDSNDSNNVQSNATLSDDDFDDEVPQACRTQWGNFDDEKIECSLKNGQPMRTHQSTSNLHQKKSNSFQSNVITEQERNLWRQEFVDVMHERFLTGDDKDFDYSKVDDNSEYDDLKQLNQDKEDAYFDCSDDDDNVENCIYDDTHNRTDNTNIMDDQEGTEDSEDDLDVYMRHLAKHPSLQVT